MTKNEFTPADCHRCVGSGTVEDFDGEKSPCPSCGGWTEEAHHALAQRYRRMEDRLAEIEEKFPCDGGCNLNDGPEETCSRHGRTPRELWEHLGEAQRDLDLMLEVVLDHIRDVAHEALRETAGLPEINPKLAELLRTDDVDLFELAADMTPDWLHEELRKRREQR